MPYEQLPPRSYGGRRRGPRPLLLSVCIEALAECGQMGSCRLAAEVRASPVMVRRCLLAHPDLVASWRFRRSRVYRLRAAGRAAAAHLEAGGDIRDLL